jgi:hypothetical protein
MPDVLGRQNSTYAGAFSADNARLVLFGAPGPGLMVQNIGVQYQQPIQTIFEVGSNYRYYVVGRPSGNMNLSQILGPTDLSLAALRRLGDPCNGQANRRLDMTLGSAACLGANRGREIILTADGCIGSGAQFNVTAEQMLVTQTVSVTFSNLATNV